MLRTFLLLVVIFFMGTAHTPKDKISSNLLLKFCNNDRYALMDHKGNLITDCEYIDLVKKSKNFYLGQKQAGSFVVLDHKGRQISAPIATRVRSLSEITFSSSSLYASQVFHLEIDHKVYLHFKNLENLEGPFLNKVKKRHGKRNFILRRGYSNGKYLINRIDSSAVLYDTLGHQIKIEQLSNTSILTEDLYTGRSDKGLLQIWNFNGTLKYEGDYETVHKRQDGFKLYRKNSETDKDPVYAYLDEDCELLIDKVNYIFPELNSNHKPKHYSTKSNQKYCILDSLLNPVLCLGNRKLFSLGDDMFYLYDEGAETMKVCQGDTTNLLIENIEGFIDLGAKLNLVTKDKKHYFYNEHYQPLDNIAYDRVTPKYDSVWKRVFLYRKDGEIGMLDSLLAPIWSLEADTMFAVKNEFYQNGDLVRDSLFSFRAGQKYGLYNLRDRKIIGPSSDDPIVISKCTDLAIYTQADKYGFYHFPSKKLFPAVYSKIASDRRPGQNKCFDCKLTGLFENDKTENFLVKNQELLPENLIDFNRINCKQTYRIQGFGKGQTLISKSTDNRLYTSEGKNMKILLDSNGGLAYLTVVEEDGLVYYDSNFKRVSPVGANWKEKTRIAKTPLPYIQVTEKKRKTTIEDLKKLKEYKGDPLFYRIFDGTTGLFDLENNKYVIPMKYDDIKSLGEGLVSVTNYRVTALANLNGEFLTDFKFTTIGDFKDGLAVAVNEDGEAMIINSKGESHLKETFARANRILSDEESSQTPILYSVLENGAAKRSKVIDESGVTQFKLPADMIYKNLPGPFDVAENKLRYKVIESILIEERTNIEIYKAIEINAFKQGEKYYYHALRKNEQSVIDNTGRVLFTLPYDSKYGNHWRGINKLHPDYFTIYGPVINSISKIAVYTLSGELVVEEAVFSGVNSFGQYVFEKGKQKYLLPPPVN